MGSCCSLVPCETGLSASPLFFLCSSSFRKIAAMELLASATGRLSPYYSSLPVQSSAVTNTRRDCSTSSISLTNNWPHIPLFTPTGCRLLTKPVRLRKCFVSAVVDEKASVPVDGSREGFVGVDDSKMVRICDKLVDVFMVDKPTSTDWRKLLAFSKEWNIIRPHFFRHCQELAESKDNPDMKHKLLKLSRKLKEIDEDVQRHNELFEVIKGSQSGISEVVARRRKDFTKEFFLHVQTVAESYYDDPTEQNALAKLGNTCLAAVEAYDGASESLDAVHAAELKFQDIINSPSLDAACRKIDSLAEKNQLDSALVLMMTKAWSAAKDSNMMKDEVKDILYHLYMTARGNLQRLMPKEIRIVKYLLTLKDPEEQLFSLREAFTPGEELEGKDLDALYTTPEKLHTWIKAVIDAYHFSKEGTLIREARDLMNPAIIQKMEELNMVVEKNFL